MSERNFKNIESLDSVRRVINDANEALNNDNRTISDSPISEVLSGALGAGAGGAISFAALCNLGIAGLSGPGIMTGLATAGSLIGGGAAAGVMVLAAPVALLAGVGVAIAKNKKMKRLREEISSLYTEAVRVQNAIIEKLKNKVNMNEERIKYLTSLNILLQAAIRDLAHDRNL